MSSKHRTHELTFRLAPPSVSQAALEIGLTAAEHKAVVKAAGKAPIGTFLRELLTEATRKAEGELPLDRARSRALAVGLTLGAYCRLVVLEAIGATDLGEDLTLARRWQAKAKQ